jgi:hypothetical protein
MTRTQAIKLIADAATKAAASQRLTQAEQTAIQVLRWMPRNIKEKGHEHTTGFVIGISRMTAHVRPKLAGTIQTALFVVEEIMRHDGLIPEEQVREVAASLGALAEPKAA